MRPGTPGDLWVAGRQVPGRWGIASTPALTRWRVAEVFPQAGPRGIPRRPMPEAAAWISLTGDINARLLSDQQRLRGQPKQRRRSNQSSLGHRGANDHFQAGPVAEWQINAISGAGQMIRRRYRLPESRDGTGSCRGSFRGERPRVDGRQHRSNPGVAYRNAGEWRIANKECVVIACQDRCR